ncbi:MAG: acylphosphatase [Deltaproteobacteria bacterium]|nr:acylphosphatase [Deltaproteobacteria bacterium]MBW1953341.1 acylphosphatase [Deltaproteobacteria bacterium]MBW1987315.1 acylphosphatase [Deltaproteobacteria bacterium]MBW2135074.1 acylphosphatase [Deltaproteobacteria bacterium]
MSKEEMVRARVLIDGMVQGVFFRAHTRDQARRYGVNGWVRNLPSGEVEALFEGDKRAVEQVIAWCHQGPPSAWVKEVKIQWEPYLGDQSGFQIVYR